MDKWHQKVRLYWKRSGGCLTKHLAGDPAHLGDQCTPLLRRDMFQDRVADQQVEAGVGHWQLAPIVKHNFNIVRFRIPYALGFITAYVVDRYISMWHIEGQFFPKVARAPKIADSHVPQFWKPSLHKAAPAATKMAGDWVDDPVPNRQFTLHFNDIRLNINLEVMIHSTGYHPLTVVRSAGTERNLTLECSPVRTVTTTNSVRFGSVRFGSVRFGSVRQKL
jgi:hypothetical protein